MSASINLVQPDVAIVGGGGAGVAAAVAAASTGATTMLLGDNLPEASILPDAIHQIKANVWGCFAGLTLAVTDASTSFTLQPHAVVLATGDYLPGGQVAASPSASPRHAESTLARMAGARAAFQPDDGGWTPVLDADRMSTISGLFVTGGAAGPCPPDVANLDGRLAGLAAALVAGYGRDDTVAQARIALNTAAPRRLQPISGACSAAESPGAAATIVCPCEGVDANTIAAAINSGAVTINDVKRRTRAGMGRCQGRDCTVVIGELIHQIADVPLDVVEPMTSRPPIRPITLGQLAAIDVHR
jgi:bacterioferritin-associated ferredoxin